MSAATPADEGAGTDRSAAPPPTTPSASRPATGPPPGGVHRRRGGGHARLTRTGAAAGALAVADARSATAGGRRIARTAAETNTARLRVLELWTGRILSEPTRGRAGSERRSADSMRRGRGRR
ncbi:hypothetical protein [Conexibacter sp. DBS9H8]|uniref:hypothetical protein n=1 Tax=Conexibacter sp. DBS9H8 TaxID=2937801 RepID=UPI00200F1F65|nr:hypothetical protein [Conexibacter sp. DBS9H8]